VGRGVPGQAQVISEWPGEAELGVTPSEVAWLVARIVSRAGEKVTPDELARLCGEAPLTRPAVIC
jgi:hypothetical protein